MQPIGPFPMPAGVTKDHRRKIENRNKLAAAYDQALADLDALRDDIQSRYHADNATDRSPVFLAELDCWRQRRAILEEDRVLSVAAEMLLRKMQREHEERGRELVATRRAELNIPAEMAECDIPLCVWQTYAPWWKHRAEGRPFEGCRAFSFEEPLTIHRIDEKMSALTARVGAEQQRAEEVRRLRENPQHVEPLGVFLGPSREAEEEVKRKARALFPTAAPPREPGQKLHS
jgi:hypothetical protein